MRAGWAEQSCAARVALLQGLSEQPPRRCGLALPEPWEGRLGLSAPVHGCGEPRLPLPAFWPEWPSSRRRAWRHGRDQFWVQWSGKRETQRCCRGHPPAFRAQNAREPSRPHDPQGNWSGSCLLARPSSANTSRICRLLTSISRARSLIRTLLIRLFSESATKALSRS